MLEYLAGLLRGEGALVLYGKPGTLRTRVAFLLCGELSPSVYIGTGRHARLRAAPGNTAIYATMSFYEELLKVIEVAGLCKKSLVQLIAIDEFMANLIPYRASLNESYVARMALTEISVLKLIKEAGCKVLLVCAEDLRTGAPLGLKILRQLKPRLVRTSIEADVLVAEERDLGNPSFRLARIEVGAGDVVIACEALLRS